MQELVDKGSDEEMKEEPIVNRFKNFTTQLLAWILLTSFVTGERSGTLRYCC